MDSPVQRSLCRIHTCPGTDYRSTHICFMPPLGDTHRLCRLLMGQKCNLIKTCFVIPFKIISLLATRIKSDFHVLLGVIYVSFIRIIIALPIPPPREEEFLDLGTSFLTLFKCAHKYPSHAERRKKGRLNK